jgi:hypothetical protein
MTLDVDAALFEAVEAIAAVLPETTKVTKNERAMNPIYDFFIIFSPICIEAQSLRFGY